MKKIVNFDKQLEFPSMIGEITSISLDQELRFKDESNITGDLIVNGTYKRTEASRLEEDFSFKLPTEIILTEKIDLNTSKIEINDFYYEVEKDDTINCHISILVEGIEVVDLAEDEAEASIELENHKTKIDKIEENTELRECDGDNTYEKQLEELSPVDEDEQLEIEEKNKVEKEADNVIIDNNNSEEINEDVGSLFTSLKDSEETFSTYSVYILRNDETIESILSKFKITKDELESYNELNNIGIGSKLIIPLHESN